MRALISSVALTTFALTGWSLAQTPGKGEAKKSLDEYLAAAMKNSPDLQVAEAKVREAQAELRRSRIALAQRVIEANNNVDAAKAKVEHAESTFSRIKKLVETGNVSQDELQNGQALLAQSKAQLAQSEATLNGLIGNLPGNIAGMAEGNTGVVGGPPGIPFGNQAAAVPGAAIGFSGSCVGGGGMLGFGGGEGGMPFRRIPTGPMAEKLRKALNTNVKSKAVKDARLPELINFQKSLVPEIPFVIHIGNQEREPVNFTLEGDVPLGALLQAMEDVVPGLKFFVREYGILVTIEGNEPPDGVPVVEFWQKPTGGT